MTEPTNETDEQKLSSLRDDEYVRQRIDPQPGDLLYLHLSDLKIGLDRLLPMDAEAIFDFGCGGSPYRTLWPADRRYDRADIEGVADVDYLIHGDKNGCDTGASADTYDLVLSSQVLEHVPNPQAYLREAYRVLRPGGQMVLSTHGVFEDHGCPHDFRRWTSYGLTEELNDAGFEIDVMAKVTTGERAALFMMQRTTPRCPRKGRYGWFLWLFNHLLEKRRALFDASCDEHFRYSRYIDTDIDLHVLYIGLMTRVFKPDR